MAGKMHDLMLDALDAGPMTSRALEAACEIAPKQRGGFYSALIKLFQRGLVETDDHLIWLSGAGRVEPTTSRVLDAGVKIYSNALRRLAER